MTAPFTNKGSKHKELGKTLTKFGYHSSGCEILYNGMTGEQLETEIYFGPTFYLRLKHMPKDKVNYRARGPRTVLTRQTVQGRANDGGLRIGEMDRDCLIAHGMSSFVKESMMVRGDQYEMAVCNKTGCVAVYNESKNIFLSPMADGPLKFVSSVDDNMNIVNVSKYGRDFSIVKVPYAFKLLSQELQAMNCQMRIITEDNVEQLTSLTAGDDIKILGFNNLEEVAEKTKLNDIETTRQKFVGMHEIGAIDDAKLMEHTPTPEAVSNSVDYFQDEQPLYNQENFDDFGAVNRVMPGEADPTYGKSSYRFNPGDLVMFGSDPEPRATYKIVEFDDEEMKYVTVAINGKFKGKYRDSWDDELETPPRSPGITIAELVTATPKTPSYSPNSPPGIPSPIAEGDENDGPDFSQWWAENKHKEEYSNKPELEEEDFSDEEGGLAPVSMSPLDHP